MEDDEASPTTISSCNIAGYIKLNVHDAKTVNLAQANETSMELERIYLLSSFQGRKLGEYMLKEAIRMAVDLRKTQLWLGVWEKNHGVALRNSTRIPFCWEATNRSIA